VVDLDERLYWFKTVILPHQGALRGRLRRVAPRGSDIDDLVSEVLARAWAVRDWAPIIAGRSYLFMIARNMLIDSARRDAIVSFELVADFDTLRHDYRPEPALDARDELRHVQAIIATLPDQARRVFVMRRVHGHSMAEIADAMALSVSTVEKHLANALMLVARAIARNEDWSVERAVRDTTGDSRKGGKGGASRREGA
jgi:RNA polymerase sigma factor (sigma-70 family)